jgi:hypothetical protein
MNNSAFDGEREELRKRYYLARQKAGLPIESAQVIERRLDAAQAKIAEARAAKANPAATSPPTQAVQPPLFDAGTETAETRKLAAVPAFERLPKRAKRALIFYARRGRYGAIPDELAQHLDIPAHSAPSIVGRLRDEGLIVATAERRLTRCNKPAVVYVASAITPPKETEGADDGKN